MSWAYVTLLALLAVLLALSSEFASEEAGIWVFLLFCVFLYKQYLVQT